MFHTILLLVDCLKNADPVMWECSVASLFSCLKDRHSHYMMQQVRTTRHNPLQMRNAGKAPPHLSSHMNPCAL